MALELIFYAILLIVGYYVLATRIRGLPPGPIPLPIFGNLLSMSNPVAKKYGPVFTVWMPDPVVVIADSKILHESIARGGDTFGDRPSFASKLMQMSDPYGVTWKEQRRFAFTSFKEVGFLGAEFKTLISSYALEVVADWKQSTAKSIDVSENLQSAISNVMWQLTFGRTFPLKHPFFSKISEVTHKLSLSIVHPCVILSESLPMLVHLDFLFGSPLKKAEAVIEEAMEITKEELKVVESTLSEDEPPNCYAAAFLKEIKRREASGSGDGNFNHQQLLLSATSHWIAGIETTVTTLRFAIHFLTTKHPQVQTRMQQEIDAKIGKREISMDDQKTLPYCMATILEIQRLANVGQLNFLRKTNKPTVVGGHRIPPGTHILPQFPSVLVDDDVFEDAEELKPERFLNADGDFVKPPEMTPFSIGVRACPGEGLAKMELFLFLTTFVQHLCFSAPPGSEKEIGIAYGLTKSLHPFSVEITARD